MLGASLSACCSAAHVTQDRLISLSNEEYDGTTKVEFVTKALGQADFFKFDPAPNANTFDSHVKSTSHTDTTVCTFS